MLLSRQSAARCLPPTIITEECGVSFGPWPSSTMASESTGVASVHEVGVLNTDALIFNMTTNQGIDNCKIAAKFSGSRQ